MNYQNRTKFPKRLSVIFQTMIVAFVVVLYFTSAGIAHDQEGRKVDHEDGLAGSTDSCVSCHRNETPGIVEQFSHSSMANAGVGCVSCHEVEAGYPGSVAHQGTYVLASPTPKMCARCHSRQVEEFNASRHSTPAWAAMKGVTDFNEEQLAMYQAVEEITEGTYHENINDLYHMEGPRNTRFGCEICHAIGRPHEDGSAGECQKCHIRHEFSLEQARKPETCGACHIGPDHPQKEIYEESPHGIMYATMGDDWNWDAPANGQSPVDFPAPTCATCHISGFGEVEMSHDVGDRLAWYLFPPISSRRPHWEENQARMQSICTQCHNQNFIDDFYTDGDEIVESVNELVLESREMFAPVQEAGLTTPEPFDQSIDYLMFDIWHYWGRVMKFGAWMVGPDYTQWHGTYHMYADLTELKEKVADMLEDAE